MHYKYHLTVIHGKSEYSYKGPVISLMRSSNEVTNLREPRLTKTDEFSENFQRVGGGSFNQKIIN